MVRPLPVTQQGVVRPLPVTKQGVRDLGGNVGRPQTPDYPPPELAHGCSHPRMRYCCDHPCGHLVCPDCGLAWDQGANK